MILVFEGADGAHAAVVSHEWASDRNEGEDSVVDVRLRRPVALRGRIAEVGSNRAVRGAAVWFLSDPGRGGRLRLKISHPEYVDLTETVADVPHGEGYLDLDVFTLPAGTEILDPGLSGEHLFRRVRTDSDGRFRLDNLVPATWSAEARDESRCAKLEGIELVRGETREIELRLQTLNRLTVRVTKHPSEPVANANVTVSLASFARPPVVGRTDAGGRTSLTVGLGAATAEVAHPDLLGQSREIVLKPGANELHVRLDPGWEIGGAVRSVEGVPIPGAAIEARQRPPDEVGSDWDARARELARLMQPSARARNSSGPGVARLRANWRQLVPSSVAS